MTSQRITKRTVDALKPNGSEFTVWDDTASGFGVRVRPTGAMSYVVVYRAGAGRGAPVRRYTIGAVGKIAPEQARARASRPGSGHGHDVARKLPNAAYPIVELRIDSWQSMSKAKAGTAGPRDICISQTGDRHHKADVTRQQVSRLHSSLVIPFQATVLRFMVCASRHG